MLNLLKDIIYKYKPLVLDKPRNSQLKTVILTGNQCLITIAAYIKYTLSLNLIMTTRA